MEPQSSTRGNGAAAAVKVAAQRSSAERLAAARQAVADKLSAVPKFSYGRVIVAKRALEGLSKLGTNDRNHAERLTAMIRYATAVADAFDQQRDAFSNYYAETDEDSGQILTREVDVPNQGKATVPIMRNEVEFNLLMNDLMRDDASKNADLGDPPAPFTYREVRAKTWGKKPDPDLIARLGPFVTMEQPSAEAKDED